MSTKLQAVRGMNDILPADIGIWHHVESEIRSLTAAYGYLEMRVPMMERTDLFYRSIGALTDIVDKEMYTFVDKNGDSLTLRPEATASCVRAGIQHGLFHNQHLKLYYMGPMFRHERPQKGRYRQFHQFGIEAFGLPGPDIDCELMQLGRRLWQRLNIQDIRLELNSLGTPEVRQCYEAALVGYLSQHQDSLDDDSRRRLQTNPLRILDSKVKTTQAIVAGAPTIDEFYDETTGRHFTGLCERLDTLGIAYHVNRKLVRGLDYYTKTVFEWVTESLGAQNAVCAGGRYDLLVENLGGRPTYGVGFALGLDRLVELARQGGGQFDPVSDVYFVALGDAAELQAAKLGETLRDAGCSVRMNFSGGNLKKQLRRADQSGARLAVILGDSERNERVVLLKNLRRDSAQERVSQEKLVEHVKQHLLSS